ncbi:MAG: cyclic nucleotide-binding domain-containing protein [Gammaproteobacteria bacterium]|nr:cyclic nucleotide-binding domain-containing protein [Gammaproteobacteria bacterium]
METIEQLIAEHAFFRGLEPEFVRFIAGCGRNVRFEAGEYVFREGGSADYFYLVRHGGVALEISAPGRPGVVIQTLEEGDIVGASWLVPPYRWSFDARATELTRAVALDAQCLRGKCEEDHHLGYELMKRFVPVMIQRLQATRLQVLDLYGP